MTYERRDSWGRTESDKQRDQAERHYIRLDSEASRILDRVSRMKSPTEWDLVEAERACDRAQEAFDRWMDLCEHKPRFTA